jgi:hypothetical protein
MVSAHVAQKERTAPIDGRSLAESHVQVTPNLDNASTSLSRGSVHGLAQ